MSHDRSQFDSLNHTERGVVSLMWVTLVRSCVVRAYEENVPSLYMVRAYEENMPSLHMVRAYEENVLSLHVVRACKDHRD